MAILYGFVGFTLGVSITAMAMAHFSDYCDCERT